MSGFNAINAVAGPVNWRRSVSDEVEPAEDSNGQGPASRQIATNLSLNAAHRAVVLRERDWSVQAIIRKRRVEGIREREVHWRPTVHTRTVVQHDSRNRPFVDVAGVHWFAASVTPVGGKRDDVLIHWQDTWHPDWELPKAMVAAWEEEHPEEHFLDQRVEPRWYSHPEVPSDYLLPEDEPEADMGAAVGEDGFVAHAGCDYTIAFLDMLRADLTRKEGERRFRLPLDTLRHFLNLHVRQRLCVTEEHSGFEFRYGSAETLRALLCYVFGQARTTPCSHCRQHPGPLPKCVTRHDMLAGKCANCACLRRGKGCEYHHTDAWFKAKQLVDVDAAVWWEAPSSPSSASDLTADDDVDETGDTDDSTNTIGTTDLTWPTPPGSQTPKPSASPSAASRSEEPESRHSNPYTPGSTSPAPVEANSAGLHAIPLYRKRSRNGDTPVVAVGSKDAAARSLHLPSNNDDDDNDDNDDDHNDDTDSTDADSDDDAKPPQTKRTRATKSEDEAPFPKEKLHYDKDAMWLRHASCNPGTGQPCQLGDSVWWRRSRARVWKHERFAAGEATTGQVSYVLGHCRCDEVEGLQVAWTRLCEEQRRQEVVSPWDVIEEYVGARWMDFINWAVRSYCPERWRNLEPVVID